MDGTFSLPPKSARNASASGAAAVVTLAAPGVGKRHVLDWVHLSYSAGTAGSTVTITSGGATIWEIDGAQNTGTIRASYILFLEGLMGGDNEEVVITQNLVTSSVNKLNVGYR